MKRYSMSSAAAIEHVPAHPDRTGYRHGSGMDFDVYYQVWSNRAAMLKTIQLQSLGPSHPSHWHDWTTSRMGQRLRQAGYVEQRASVAIALMTGGILWPVALVFHAIGVL